MAFLIATLLLVLLSLFMGPLQNNTPSTPDEHSRPRSDSTASTKSDVKCDSGYASEDEHPDQGQYLPSPHSMQSLTKSFTDHVRSSALQRPSGSNGGHFAISERKLLYSIITLLLIYIIDMKLLVLPFFALVLAVVIASVFTPLVDVEHIFDLSAFRVDWMAKEKTAPIYVDQASSTTAPRCDQADAHNVASTPTQDGQTSSSQKVRGMFVPITAAQDKEMRRSQALRDRVRRPGIHPSQRIVKEIKIEEVEVEDVVDYEIDRSDVPFPCAMHSGSCHHGEFPCAKDVKIDQNIKKTELNEATFMVMPELQPGSEASKLGYDGGWSVHPLVLENGILKENPFKWVETTKKWVHASLAFLGSWLIVTPQGNYVFQWHPSLHVWWCEDHGFGFHEISPEDVDEGNLETCRFFAGDINKPIPDMIGPDRTAKNVAGPYWHEAVAAHWKWCGGKPEDQKEQAGATSQKKSTRATKQTKRPARATRQKGSVHKQDFNFAAQQGFNFSTQQQGFNFSTPQDGCTFAGSRLHNASTGVHVRLATATGLHFHCAAPDLWHSRNLGRTDAAASSCHACTGAAPMVGVEENDSASEEDAV
jgi:hypothetical protein